MAATASELRRIYTNLFSDPEDPARLHRLRRALDEVDRALPESRHDADRILALLNDGLAPDLTLTQLECLRSVLSAKAFAPLMPTAPCSPAVAAQLIALYKSLFA